MAASPFDHLFPSAVREPDGDGDARFKHLYESYWNELRRYVSATFGAGPPDPEDVAQAAFAKFMTLRDSHLIANPRAFLYATARNIVLDFNRHFRLVRRHALDAAQTAHAAHVEEASPERILLGRERASVLTAVVSTLPPKQRRALLLNRLHGLSYSEIAAQLGSSKSDVKRQIERALAAVEAALDAAD